MAEQFKHRRSLPVEPVRYPGMVVIGDQAPDTLPPPVRALAKALRERVAGEVRFDAGSRAVYSTDASNYRQVPIGVILPRSADDVIAAVAVCRDHGAPVTSRGGGTSLAGQACNAAVILDFSKYMNAIVRIDPDERVAVVEPGCTLDRLRDAAEPYGLTFGPDPATHDHNSLGGMIGNNSCGVHSVMAQLYGPGPLTRHQVRALDILTYDGERMTVGPTTDDELARIIAAGGRRGQIYADLARLRDRCAGAIRARYPDVPRLVSGYNLDALLPENHFDVAQALVGTEGTCAVVLSATLTLGDADPDRSQARARARGPGLPRRVCGGRSRPRDHAPPARGPGGHRRPADLVYEEEGPAPRGCAAFARGRRLAAGGVWRRHPRRRRRPGPGGAAAQDVRRRAGGRVPRVQADLGPGGKDEPGQGGGPARARRRPARRPRLRAHPPRLILCVRRRRRLVRARRGPVRGRRQVPARGQRHDVPKLHGDPRGGALDARSRAGAVRDDARRRGRRRLARRRGQAQPGPLPGVQGLQERLPGQRGHGDVQGRVFGSLLPPPAAPARGVLDGPDPDVGADRVADPARGQLPGPDAAVLHGAQVAGRRGPAAPAAPVRDRGVPAVVPPPAAGAGRAARVRAARAAAAWAGRRGAWRGRAARGAAVARHVYQLLAARDRGRGDAGAGGGRLPRRHPAPAAVLRPAAVRLGDARPRREAVARDPGRAAAVHPRGRAGGGPRAELRGRVPRRVGGPFAPRPRRAPAGRADVFAERAAGPRRLSAAAAAAARGGPRPLPSQGGAGL